MWGLGSGVWGFGFWELFSRHGNRARTWLVDAASKSRAGDLDAATSAAQASPATASSSSVRPLAGVRALGVAT